MNKPLRRVAIAMMAMTVLLLGNVTYVQVIRADELRKDPRNSRTLYEEYSKPRGQIIAGGQSLANSVPTSDNLKFLRQYPNGPAFAPVTGYYSFVYGANGIEKAQNDMLDGSADSLAFARLRDMISSRDPQGGNVELTINPAMQRAAYDQLTKRGFTGSVVALNPRDGEILAMANTPSYDPNLLASHDASNQEKAWNQLSSAPGNPMVNRAVSQIYPPGSTFKLITLATALQNGYTPDTRVTAAPSITLPGTSTELPNYDNENCGSGSTAALWEALARSCNTAFATIAGQLGPDKLRQQAEAFGFDQDLQVPMNVAKSTLGPMADPPSVFQSGIGQRDVRVTPLQNAMVTAAIANDGKLMKPQLVKGTRAPDMSTIDEYEPQEIGQSLPADTAHTIRDMMVKTEQMTKGEGKISGVTIASKTGTAEHGDELNHPHGWYVAFAPAENPQIAVAVIVENGGDRGAEATGASIAAPIAREVIRAGLQGGG